MDFYFTDHPSAVLERMFDPHEAFKKRLKMQSYEDRKNKNKGQKS